MDYRHPDESVLVKPWESMGVIATRTSVSNESILDFNGGLVLASLLCQEVLDRQSGNGATFFDAFVPGYLVKYHYREENGCAVSEVRPIELEKRQELTDLVKESFREDIKKVYFGVREA